MDKIEKTSGETTVYGINPFVTISNGVTYMNLDTKKGIKKFIHTVKDTGVVIAYGTYKVQRCDMSIPSENKLYWKQRAKLKSLFFKSLLKVS